jgi:hypothetical protein
MTALLDFYEEMEEFTGHWRDIMARSTKDYITISSYELLKLVKKSSYDDVGLFFGVDATTIKRWWTFGLMPKKYFSILKVNEPEIADAMYLKGDLS